MVVDGIKCVLQDEKKRESKGEVGDSYTTCLFDVEPAGSDCLLPLSS